MKIKSAYYLKSIPGRIAVKLSDGKIKTAALIPFRSITEAELTELPALNSPLYAAAMLTDEIPAPVLRFYGLEKV